MSQVACSASDILDSNKPAVSEAKSSASQLQSKCVMTLSRYGVKLLRLWPQSRNEHCRGRNPGIACELCCCFGEHMSKPSGTHWARHRRLFTVTLDWHAVITLECRAQQPRGAPVVGQLRGPPHDAVQRDSAVARAGPAPSSPCRTSVFIVIAVRLRARCGIVISCMPQLRNIVATLGGSAIGGQCGTLRAGCNGWGRGCGDSTGGEVPLVQRQRQVHQILDRLWATTGDREEKLDRWRPSVHPHHRRTMVCLHVRQPHYFRECCSARNPGKTQTGVGAWQMPTVTMGRTAGVGREAGGVCLVMFVGGPCEVSTCVTWRAVPSSQPTAASCRKLSSARRPARAPSLASIGSPAGCRRQGVNCHVDMKLRAASTHRSQACKPQQIARGQQGVT